MYAQMVTRKKSLLHTVPMPTYIIKIKVYSNHGPAVCMMMFFDELKICKWKIYKLKKFNKTQSYVLMVGSLMVTDYSILADFVKQITTIPD